ncbi:MAG: DMT family transporter [Desulfuromusa sp.]|nr:DMT family transporter [Desulfuromusa sp.]
MTLTAVLILSPDALLVRLIQADLWTLLFWRCLLTGMMMSLFLAIRYRQRFLHSFYAIGKTGLLSAVTIIIGSLLFVSSLKHTAAANALIILAATPIISSLLSWIFLREKIPRRTWLSIFTCFGGILLIFSGSLQKGLLPGDLMALGATAMWGSNLVIIRSGKAVNMIPANVLGNLCVVPIVYFLGAQPLLVASVDAGLLLLLGGVILPVSFAMITLSPRYLQAPEVSLILLIETILGPIWVWLVLEEVPHSRTLIAGLLILGTLLTHTLFSLRQLQTGAQN